MSIQKQDGTIDHSKVQLAMCDDRVEKISSCGTDLVPVDMSLCFILVN